MARSAASRCLAAGALLVAFTGVAMAQGGAKADCAKAATAIERTICGSPELSTVERKTTAAYAALIGKLGGAAKDHLAADQARWLANRNIACVGEPAEIADCLETRTRDRAARLATRRCGRQRCRLRARCSLPGSARSVHV